MNMENPQNITPPAKIKHIWYTHSWHPVFHSLNEAYQYILKHLPWHISPSPEYPSLQAHVKDPGVLVHVAF